MKLLISVGTSASEPDSDLPDVKILKDSKAWLAKHKLYAVAAPAQNYTKTQFIYRKSDDVFVGNIRDMSGKRTFFKRHDEEKHHGLVDWLSNGGNKFLDSKDFKL